MLGVLYGGFNNIFFFPADQSFITCMGIESKDCNTWFINTKITYERIFQDIQFGKNGFPV